MVGRTSTTTSIRGGWRSVLRTVQRSTASMVLASIASGQCTASLPGNYSFPIICKANVVGTIIGDGELYATCGNGVTG